MKLRRLYMLAGMAALIAVLVSGFFTTGIGGSMAGSKAQAQATATPPPFPDAYKMRTGEPSAHVAGVTSTSPDGLSHPCSNLLANPPFQGLSPIAIAYPRATCSQAVNMGDVATWQNLGHDYVGVSGFGGLNGGGRMYFIYNVDDPYNPVLLKEQTFPAGGIASLSIFDWKQNSNQYMSVTMRGSGTGCGWFVYNVNDPANPVEVGRKSGGDWCTVHEHFVSLDAGGNADYAWLAMSSESGSGDKIVALDIHDLSNGLANTFEAKRYERPDGSSFIHDSNVVRGKFYVAHWSGGLQIFDKAAFVAPGTPVPLNPINSIRPSGFMIHHVVPTTDDKYVLVQDEFINSTSLGKVKMYDIQNISSPTFVTEIVGGDSVANQQNAHNMIIQPLSPGVDLLYNAWYKAGIRGYKIDTTQATPTITQVFRHQLNSDQSQGWDNVWGVDYLPCTLRGLQRTCMYAGDMTFGLIVNAVNTDNFQSDPSLDPYTPGVPVINPVDGSTCAITISGTASDYWSGLDRVEVSTDNGGTWNLATGTTNWTYQWNNPPPGVHLLQSRAYDMAENMTLSAVMNVTITANCPLTTPTAGPTFTVPPVPTFTPTRTNTAVSTSTSTATNTPVAPTATNTAVSTSTSTATSTAPVPTATHAVTVEPTATETAVVPTATDTAVAPTATETAVAPTATETGVVPTATATIIPCDMTFSDVMPGDTFYDYIHCLFCNGIISGYSDNTFRPANNITRGQIAKVIALSAGYEDVISEQAFEDVASGSTFYTWIGQLEMHNVISGYACSGPGEPCGAGNLPYFRPNNNATRGQMAKIIVMAAELPINTTGGPHFSDVATGSTFYDYVETLFNAGAIGGYPDGTFRPSNSVTRGQTSKMVVLVFFPECVAR